MYASKPSRPPPSGSSCWSWSVTSRHLLRLTFLTGTEIVQDSSEHGRLPYCALRLAGQPSGPRRAAAPAGLRRHVPQHRRPLHVLRLNGDERLEAELVPGPAPVALDAPLAELPERTVALRAGEAARLP